MAAEKALKLPFVGMLVICQIYMYELGLIAAHSIMGVSGNYGRLCKGPGHSKDSTMLPLTRCARARV